MELFPTKPKRRGGRRKGTIVPPDVREKMKATHVGFLGRKHTEESKEKIRQKLKGRPLPEEVKEKLKNNLTDEEREKRSLRLRGNTFKKGKRVSKEGRERISDDTGLIVQQCKGCYHIVRGRCVAFFSPKSKWANGKKCPIYATDTKEK